MQNRNESTPFSWENPKQNDNKQCTNGEAKPGRQEATFEIGVATLIS